MNQIQICHCRSHIFKLCHICKSTRAVWISTNHQRRSIVQGNGWKHENYEYYIIGLEVPIAMVMKNPMFWSLALIILRP
jgi:hypothetical protein